MSRLKSVVLAFAVLAAASGSAVRGEHAATSAPIEIGYITRNYVEPIPISLLEPILTDDGVQGARLGVSDNNATGKFLHQDYRLTEVTSKLDSDFAADARALLAKTHLIVANLEDKDLLALSDLTEAKDAIIINVRSSSDEMRGEACRLNLFHVMPSWAMRADALAQYMAWKKWRAWFLLHGKAKADEDYALAIKRAAKKFGSKIVDERTITFDPGNRRSETGHQQIQSQIPVLTQSPPEHDVVFVADTQETFGAYLLWRTAVPKPVIGTHGLIAVAWHQSYEQYGGVQLQKRFESEAKRNMTERDYAAWLAARIFGEAVTRSNKTDEPSLRAYIMSKDFRVAGFKGQAMSFRSWDRQLRQPIILTGPLSLVSMSPQEGFLHERFLTDTLGVDEPETKCKLPG